MPTPPPEVDNSDSQIETQDQDIQYEEDIVEEQPAEETAAQAPSIKKKREKKEPLVLTREPGKSLLPFSRVQKIIKADKDIPIIAKDATYLISLATEEFIKRLCMSAQKVASRDRRTTVQHKDIATVVRKADEFLFLEDVIPWLASDAAPKRPKPKATKDEQLKSGGSTTLDKYVTASKPSEVIDDEDIVMENGDILLNEDGTMRAI